MDKDAQMGPLNSFKQLEIIEKNIKATIDQGCLLYTSPSPRDRG